MSSAVLLHIDKYILSIGEDRSNGQSSGMRAHPYEKRHHTGLNTTNNSCIIKKKVIMKGNRN